LPKQRALRLEQPGAFQSPVSNFQMGDVIDIAGLGATAALYSAGDPDAVQRDDAG
jgi:hypothetical protein